MSEQHPSTDPTTPASDPRRPGALARSAVAVHTVPERDRLVTLELVHHVVTQLTWGRGQDRRAVSAGELGIGEPPAILMARTVEEARHAQEHAYELIGADEGVRLVRVAVDGEVIVSPIFLMPEILAELEQEPDFSLAGADLVVYLTSPTDMLLVDARDTESARAALSMAIRIYQEHPDRVSPMPYRWVGGRLERWTGGGDELVEELLGQTGVWFHQLQHTMLKEYFEEGDGRAWFEANNLAFVPASSSRDGVMAEVRASDFTDGRKLLVPAVQVVRFIDDRAEGEAGMDKQVDSPLERLVHQEIATVEPGMRPHMFRLTAFPDAYQVRDLLRSATIAQMVSEKGPEGEPEA